MGKKWRAGAEKRQSLKRVKVEEKLLWNGGPIYRNSPTLFRTVASPTPTPSSSSILRVRNPHPKLQSLLSQERVKLRTANLAVTFIASIRTKGQSPLKIWEKREHGRIQRLPKVFKYPLLSQERVKLRTSNFARTFTGSIETKPFKSFGKSIAVGLLRDLNIFKAPTI